MAALEAGSRPGQAGQQWQQWLTGRAALAPFHVPADRRLQKPAGTARGGRFVHEAVDEAIADQGREQGLVGPGARHADDDIGELFDDLLDQRVGAGRARGHVEQQYATTSGDQQVRCLVR